MTKDGAARHRVVIVGGGFSGLFAARRLRHAKVQVTLVDRSANHVFQPMLYQCATGLVAAPVIAPTLRSLLRRQHNLHIMMAEVVGIDLEQQAARARTPSGHELTIEYDSLVVGAGFHTSYFGHDEFAAYAPGMKTVDDALAVGRRIFGAFEIAAETTDPLERQSWLTFAIVGAGPTGVELAGQIRQAVSHTLRREFKTIDPRSCRVLLFDGGNEPLANFGDRLSGRATRTLKKMGVEIHMGGIATAVDASGLTVKTHDGQVTRYDARTVIWAAGVAASPLGRMLAEQSGAQTDRAGRVQVLPDCTLPGHPEVFVVGDMMNLRGLPGVAEVAMQSGSHAASNIVGRLGGDTTHPFRYVDLGSMAMVGRASAVVDFRGLKVSGFLGWLLWIGVHVFFLSGIMNRMAALLSWFVALFGSRRNRIFAIDDLGLPADTPGVMVGPTLSGTRNA